MPESPDALVERLMRMVATPHVSFHYADDVEAVRQAAEALRTLSAEKAAVERKAQVILDAKASWEAMAVREEHRATAAEAALAEARRALDAVRKVIEEGYTAELVDRKCQHDRWSHEDCVACYDEALLAALRHPEQ